MTSAEHNQECIDRYAATGVLESPVDAVANVPSCSPSPELVRGRCPECGDHLLSNCYYCAGRGYIITYECWSSLNERPTCSYRKVI